jgi:DNA-binding NtrC family response regulator
LAVWDAAIVDDTSRARILSRQGPVLLLTTMSERSNAVEAMRGGVYNYLLTPFEPGEAVILLNRALRSHNATPPPTTPYDFSGPLVPLEKVENQYILEVLRRCRNNQAEAARVLGIGRNTLWRKLKKIRAQDPHQG